jgi:hypothetical protein
VLLKEHGIISEASRLVEIDGTSLTRQGGD